VNVRAGGGAARPAVGVRLALYAAGGSTAGILGLGTLWRGAAAARWGAVLLGLALLVGGLLFAGVALAAGMLVAHQRRLRTFGRAAPPSE
jgi:hypothetical protein